MTQALSMIISNFRNEENIISVITYPEDLIREWNNIDYADNVFLYLHGSISEDLGVGSIGLQDKSSDIVKSIQLLYSELTQGF